MFLKAVYTRFYKSFNYDHLRKVHPKAKFYPWDMLDGQTLPYVKVPLEQSITAIVGANESGKSHLLSAIEKGINGEQLEGRDICRYSRSFSVEQGKIVSPQIGLEWSGLSKAELTRLSEILEIGALDTDHFLMFRTSPGRLLIYLPDEEDYATPIELGPEQQRILVETILPRSFRIDPDIALPNRIPIAWLAKEEPSNLLSINKTRQQRMELQRRYEKVNPAWIANAPAVQANHANLFNTLFTPSEHPSADEPSEDSLNLARSLLLDVANVDASRLEELYLAVENGDDGHANGLVEEINKEIDKQLNFRSWWVQDKNFSLRLDLRDSDLVFIIQDRTGTDYTFQERSSGLKYFLSYYVQYKAHDRKKEFPEVLLMDEPDAFLSADGQQDLLKIFQDFVRPMPGSQQIQIVYVTHSPFLIDKNHAERIRVLQKGRDREGTRVISNAAQNHYEPLRSAFGAFVGETAFVGNCNLILEGQADQIMLAGAAQMIFKTGVHATSESLDLNKITLVPAGSAGHVPYVVYLTRGRDEHKPAVLVLLDSDVAGKSAAKKLRSKPSGTKLLDSKYVQLLGEIKGLNTKKLEFFETEDLIPVPLAVRATNRYLGLLSEFREGDAPELKVEDVQANMADAKGLFHAINKAVEYSSPEGDWHVEKIGFAKAVLECASEELDSKKTVDTSSQDFMENMKVLFLELNRLRRSAEREVLREKITRKVDRMKETFSMDHQSTATREEALNFFEELEEIMDESKEADSIRKMVVDIKRDYELTEDITNVVQNHQSFLRQLDVLKFAPLIDSGKDPS